ncbi:D-lactaldehyde dehydrogenase [Panus rudis PR-1116 ss-1]|nr:D-lactaldehyde dehydrogenase [Panus rudis PR-1116 ss-1]
MPAVQSGSKVLVTGANGFVAVWLVRKLLQDGYYVRGTIRSPTKGDYLKKLFRAFEDRLELVVIPDFLKDGAFDDAVKDVDAIEHTASPYTIAIDDPADVIEPAVKGTLGVLHSVLKHGNKVKRVVITSSTGAVFHPVDKHTVFTENDWNYPAIDEVKAKGKDAPGFSKYFASKTMAERAAFDFYDRIKTSVDWDMITIEPPYIFGPIMNEVSDVSSANTSLIELYHTLLKSAKTPDELKTMGHAWIDVRDVALAHVRAIQRPEAEGRVIISAGSFIWQEIVNVARAIDPHPYPTAAFAPGNSSFRAKKEDYFVNYDTSKAENVLSMTRYITLEESIKDTLEDFKLRGW